MQVLFMPYTFNKIGSRYNEEIGKQQFKIADFFCGNGVDYRYGNDNEKIGHFPYWEGVGAVPQYGKYSKKTKSKAQFQFYTGHHIRYEEDQYVKDKKGKCKLTLSVMLVVVIINNEEGNKQVENKPDQ